MPSTTIDAAPPPSAPMLKPGAGGWRYGTACFLFLALFLFLWINLAFQGNVGNSFSPSGPVPKLEASVGMRPVANGGWDAQYYYYVSNDIWAHRPVESFFDLPAYRYQRAGVALVSAAVASVLGFDVTPPILYDLIQILVISLGFATLARWLSARGLSPLWACGWLLSVGVINCIAFGMPDPVADALMIIAVVAALEGVLWRYALAAGLMVLVRENLVLLAFLLFVLTAIRKVQWRAGYLASITTTALPGVVFILWQGVLFHRFGHLPSKEAGSDLFTFPFNGFVRVLLVHLKMGPVREVVGSLEAMGILLFALFACGVSIRRSWVWAAVFAQLALILCTGAAVWELGEFYFKLVSACIAMLILLMPHYRQIARGIPQWLWKAALIVLALQGAGAFILLRSGKIYLPLPPESTGLDVVKSNPRAVPITDFRSEVTAPSSMTQVRRGGVIGLVRREVGQVDLSITNRSSQPFYRIPLTGPLSVGIGYRIHPVDGGKTIEGSLQPLPHDLVPGATLRVPASIVLPPPGRYEVEFSLVQNLGGQGWAQRPLQQINAGPRSTLAPSAMTPTWFAAKGGGKAAVRLDVR